jgi:hypothetical protein
MSKKSYNGRSTPSEFIAGWFHSRGIAVDAERLEDRVLAERDRSKYDRDQLLDSVRTQASMVKRARKACELAEWAWRENPSSDNLAAAMAAQKARNAAEAELLERCQNDRGLMSAVLRQV